MARNFPVEILVRFIFVWIGVAAVYGQSPSYCQYNGYNINPLQNTSSDYVINSGLYIYYINVCGPVLAKQCLPTQAVTCQTWNGGKATLSVYNTGTAGPLSRSSGSEGFTVQFSGGDQGRSMEIDFVCSASAGIGSPSLQGENPKNHYIFTWNTQYVCTGGGSGGLSGGSIFLIIVLCVAVVYITAGILFNKFKKQATGIELIPNVEFWSSIPGLFKDGWMLIINKIRGRGGYSQV